MLTYKHLPNTETHAEEDLHDIIQWIKIIVYYQNISFYSVVKIDESELHEDTDNTDVSISEIKALFH